MDIYLSASDLSFQYDKQAPVLTGVNFVVGPQDFVLLTGANGAGKSTLLKLLMGQLIPSSGQLFRIKEVSYVAQNSILDVTHFPATVDEILNTGLYGQPKSSWESQKVAILKQLNLLDLRQTKISHLSGGQKQRILLGRALLEKPKCLVLDEPLNGIDEQSCQQLEEILFHQHQKGMAILMVSHRWKLSKSVLTAHWVLQNGVLNVC